MAGSRLGLSGRWALGTSLLTISSLLLSVQAEAQAQPDQAPASQSQSTAATAEQAAQDNDIVVTGTRASLVSAQELKRDAPIVAEFISAEDIGRYTDNNLAETLQRVPGVQVSRGQSGEATFIQIRGLGSTYVVSTVDGRSVFGGSGGDEGLGNRNGFALDTVAPELTAGVQILKSNSADQLDGGIAGAVNILTLRPLDLKLKDGLYDDNLYLVGNAEGTVSVEAKKVDPRVSGLLSWRNADKTFGIVASGAYSKRSTQTQIASLLSTDTDDTIGGVANVFRAGIVNYENDPGTVKRLGLSGSMQWRPSDELEVTFDGLYNRQKIERIQNSLRAYLPGDIGATVINPDVQSTNGVGVGGILFGGTIPVTATGDQPTGQVQSAYTLYDRKEYAFAGHVRFRPNDGPMTMEFDAAYFNSDFVRQDDLAGYQISNFYGATLGNNLKKQATLYSFSPNPVTSAAFDPEQIVTGDPNEFGFNRIFAGGDQQSYRLDGTYDIDGSFFKDIKFGLTYRRRNQDQVFNVIRYGQSDLNSIAAAGGVSPAQLINVNTAARKVVEGGAGGFLSEVSGVPYDRWLGIDNRAVFDFYRPLIDKSFAARGTSVDFRGFDPSLGLNFGPFGSGGSFNGREDNLAGYAMLDVDSRLGGLKLRGNAGLRLVNIDREGTGYIVATQIDPATGNTVLIANGSPVTSTQLVTRKGNDFSILPSANLTLGFTDSLQLRLAGSQTVSQPDLGAVAGPGSVGFQIAGDGQTIQAVNVSLTNPDLKPYKANLLDISAEWYPGNSGAFLAAAFFFKDIGNLITAQSTTPSSVIVNGITYTAAPNLQLNVNQPINSQDRAKITGVELQGHLPLTAVVGNNATGVMRFIGSFGVQGSYTKLLKNSSGSVETTTGEQLPFPFASRNNYSVTGYYDDGRLSSRVSYTYRSSAYTGTGFFGSGLFVLSYANLDANLSYRLTRNINVRVQALNLLDEASRQSTAGGQLPYLYAQNGRQFIFGAQLQF